MPRQATPLTDTEIKSLKPKATRYRTSDAGEMGGTVACVEALCQLCNDLRQRLTASRTTQGHLAEALVDVV